MEKKIVLSCKECGSRNYSTTSNKRSERLKIKKFCKICGTHTIHCETK